MSTDLQLWVLYCLILMPMIVISSPMLVLYLINDIKLYVVLCFELWFLLTWCTGGESYCHCQIVIDMCYLCSGEATSGGNKHWGEDQSEGIGVEAGFWQVWQVENRPRWPGEETSPDTGGESGTCRAAAGRGWTVQWGWGGDCQLHIVLCMKF